MIKLTINAPKHISFDALLQSLIALAYQRVNMVLEPGEFAVRGAIIDVFPSNHSNPIRIEYDDQVIDRITSFALHTQCSITTLKETSIQQYEKTQYAHQLTEGETLDQNRSVSPFYE